MDSEQKIQERKNWNAPFLRAFNYLLDELSVNKGTLCALIGIERGLISKYNNGTKKVSIDTMNALARVSNNTPGGMLNVNYMLGKSKYMLLSNVPDEEILEVEMRRNNPDYDVLQRIKKQKSPEPQDPEDNEKAAETSMVSLAATLIKETEIIRRTLSEALENVNKLRDQLSTELSNITAIHADMQLDRDAIRAIRTQLSSLLYSMSSSDYRLPMAAENQDQ